MTRSIYFFFALMTFVYASNTAFAESIDLGKCFGPSIVRWREAKRLNENEFVSQRDDRSCEKLVKSLKPGDTVSFSDHSHFQLDRRLGRGGSVFVWAVKDDPNIAIRIPLGSMNSFRHMELFLTGWEKLTKLRFPSVQVIDPENSSLEYQLVERVNFKFTFQQWENRLTNPAAHRTLISKPVFLKAMDALLALAEQSLLLAEIGEGLQMGFDGQHWRMFDFGSDISTFIKRNNGKSLSEKTIWDGYLHGDKRLKQKILEAVLSKRRELCARILATKVN